MARRSRLVLRRHQWKSSQKPKSRPRRQPERREKTKSSSKTHWCTLDCWSKIRLPTWTAEELPIPTGAKYGRAETVYAPPQRRVSPSVFSKTAQACPFRWRRVEMASWSDKEPALPTGGEKAAAWRAYHAPPLDGLYQLSARLRIAREYPRLSPRAGMEPPGRQKNLQFQQAGKALPWQVFLSSSTACIAVGSFTNSSSVVVPSPRARKTHPPGRSKNLLPRPWPVAAPLLLCPARPRRLALLLALLHEQLSRNCSSSAERWNGTSWSVQEPPAPTGSTHRHPGWGVMHLINICMAYGTFTNGSTCCSWPAEAENGPHMVGSRTTSAERCNRGQSQRHLLYVLHGVHRRRWLQELGRILPSRSRRVGNNHIAWTAQEQQPPLPPGPNNRIRSPAVGLMHEDINLYIAVGRYKTPRTRLFLQPRRNTIPEVRTYTNPRCTPRPSRSRCVNVMRGIATFTSRPYRYPAHLIRVGCGPRCRAR